MQFEKANRLFQSTTKEQKEACNHIYEKEYYLSASTGDYVCSKCGDTMLESEYLERRKEESKIGHPVA